MNIDVQENKIVDEQPEKVRRISSVSWDSLIDSLKLSGRLKRDDRVSYVKVAPDGLKLTIE